MSATVLFIRAALTQDTLKLCPAIEDSGSPSYSFIGSMLSVLSFIFGEEAANKTPKVSKKLFCMSYYIIRDFINFQ